MLRVHSLFPQHTTCRQTAIQTQSPNKYPHLNYTSQVFKNSKLINTLNEDYNNQSIDIVRSNVHSMTSSCAPTGWEHLNKTRKFRINKKQNTSGSDLVRKIEATKFNFIKFDDKMLNQALKKYIKRIPLTKTENKELQKQINLNYKVSQQPYSQQLFRNIRGKQSNQKHSLKTTIKQLVESVTKSTQKTKDTKKYRQEVQIKRIQWKIQKLLALKQPITLSNSIEFTQINLQTILKSYNESMEEQCLKPFYNKKGYLQRFYEQIFTRYENIPFSQYNEIQNNNLLPVQEIRPYYQKSKRSNMRASGRKSKLNKMVRKSNLLGTQKVGGFQNNLRKQIKNLADQSERILVDQNRKVNKF